VKGEGVTFYTMWYKIRYSIRRYRFGELIKGSMDKICCSLIDSTDGGGGRIRLYFLCSSISFVVAMMSDFGSTLL
jgi:hypothetical protein